MPSRPALAALFLLALAGVVVSDDAPADAGSPAPVADAAAPAPSDAAPSCTTLGAPCCPAGSPGFPADRPAVPFCVGDALICYSADPAPTCKPFPPPDCGATGQPCCPGAYHNPTDKKLPPACANASDWCAGNDGCVANDADCGAEGKKPCKDTSGGVSVVLVCKDGTGLLDVMDRDGVCVTCPPGKTAKNLGSTVCSD